MKPETSGNRLGDVGRPAACLAGTVRLSSHRHRVMLKAMLASVTAARARAMPICGSSDASAPSDGRSGLQALADDPPLHRLRRIPSAGRALPNLDPPPRTPSASRRPRHRHVRPCQILQKARRSVTQPAHVLKAENLRGVRRAYQKRQFGRVKTRHCGLAKNRAQILILFALGNLSPSQPWPTASRADRPAPKFPQPPLDRPEPKLPRQVHLRRLETSEPQFSSALRANFRIRPIAPALGRHIFVFSDDE